MSEDSRAPTALGEEMLLPAMRWMAEQVPGGFFVYLADESQRLIYVNQVCLRLFGCETEEQFRVLTGFTFRGLVHPEDYEKIQSSIDEQIADPDNGNLDYVEYRIQRRDGAVRWVDDYGHFAHLPGYGDVYYVFISDITEKHELQEELHRRARVYEGMLAQFNAIADDSLTVFRSNISTGVLEEARGRDLYPCDYQDKGTVLLSYHAQDKRTVPLS
ncbi:MAG: PAS domain-containing protein [Oscillospiraceae bacterium]|nr:PAS domain-containing protein [Oscillospiraceae bacterium]